MINDMPPNGGEYPPAPACPSWCRAHEQGCGWEVDPFAVTKTCRRVVECVGGAEITLERFASLDGYRLEVDDPVVRLQCDEPLAPAAALTVAATLTRVAEMSAEPSYAAA